MNLHRSITEPPRANLTWDEQWAGVDQGLIACWERGRAMRVESPKIAAAALDGQLPVLSWKGGVEKEIKKKEKFGTLNYVAMWQGLRGDSLNIDTDQELTLTCTATNMRVVYTSDVKKFTESTEA